MIIILRQNNINMELNKLSVQNLCDNCAGNVNLELPSIAYSNSSQGKCNDLFKLFEGCNKNQPEMHQFEKKYVDYVYVEGGKNYYSIDLIDNCKLFKICNKFALKYLTFTSNTLKSVETFKKCTENCNLELLVDNVSICSFDFSLLYHFNDVHYMNEKFSIAIPNFLMPDMYLNENSNIDGFIMKIIFNTDKLLLENGFLKLEQIMSDYVFTNTKKNNAIFLQTVKNADFRSKYLATSNNNYCFTINNKHLNVKGYFIECDVDKLTEFMVIINGHDYLYCQNMNEIMLLCHKINNRLLYFSYDGSKNYDKLNAESFNSSIDHSQIDQVRIILKYKCTHDDTIKIYTVGTL